MNQSYPLHRRSFLASAGAGAATLALLPPSAGAADAPVRRGKLIEAGRKLNIACIGCGGKGVSDVAGVSSENIVALCDVDSVQARQVFGRFPAVPKYQDFRKMLRELDDQIDAVTISTPDHLHGMAAMAAMVFAAPAHASRIKDVVAFEGVRDNMLLGYGLVVGLNGSGDKLQNNAFTEQSLIEFLERQGVNTRGLQLKSKNVAAVTVTAQPPPGAGAPAEPAAARKTAVAPPPVCGAPPRPSTTPSTANATPPSTPCTIAMTMLPFTVARTTVTNWSSILCAWSSRSGKVRAIFCDSSRPSRSRKNSKYSITNRATTKSSVF